MKTVNSNDLEKIDVVSIKLKGYGGPCIFKVEKNEKGESVCPNLIEDISLFLSEDDGPWEVEVKRFHMSRKEYENLPDFAGW